LQPVEKRRRKIEAKLKATVTWWREAWEVTWLSAILSLV